MPLTVRRVLFKQTGENSTTPMDPVHEVVSEVGTVVTYQDKIGYQFTCDTRETVACCVSPDFDMLVDVPHYAVRDVVLPDWLPTSEWLLCTTRWKWVWGLGADSEWPEAWQRGLASIADTTCRLAAIKLLRTKAFRSDFRRKMRDQVVAWLETAEDARKYSSPLSYRQWAAIIDTHLQVEAKRYDNGLYNNRGTRDARKAA